jgi:hypothetical protein
MTKVPYSAKIIPVIFGETGTLALFPTDDDVAKSRILGMAVTAQEGVDLVNRPIVTEVEANSMFITLVSGKRRLELPLSYFIPKKKNDYVEINLNGYSTSDSKIQSFRPVAGGSVLLFTFFYDES